MPDGRSTSVRRSSDAPSHTKKIGPKNPSVSAKNCLARRRGAPTPATASPSANPASMIDTWVAAASAHSANNSASDVRSSTASSRSWDTWCTRCRSPRRSAHHRRPKHCGGGHRHGRPHPRRAARGPGPWPAATPRCTRRPRSRDLRQHRDDGRTRQGHARQRGHDQRRRGRRQQHRVERAVPRAEPRGDAEAHRERQEPDGDGAQRAGPHAAQRRRVSHENV